MIEIKDLVYQYPASGEEAVGNVAVDGVNLNIEKGEFIAVLGHNGSGKSTMAKCINGLHQPTSGEVLVDGLSTKDMEQIWNIRSRAGMVFQNPDNQIVATIVEEDVAFGAENLGVPREELRRRVDWALSVVDMTGYERHAPHLLSGGQKQRVAIAGILAMNPDYIILDEPTSMLDPSGRKEVMETVTRLNREEGKTIILITHYMEEAVQADRVVVMEKGKIILEGSPREVFVHVGTMKEIGLGVPQVTELTRELIDAGIELNPEVLNEKEFVEGLCHYLKSEI